MLMNLKTNLDCSRRSAACSTPTPPAEHRSTCSHDAADAIADSGDATPSNVASVIGGARYADVYDSADDIVYSDREDRRTNGSSECQTSNLNHKTEVENPTN